MFNEICINEEMLPKYTYIYISVRSYLSVYSLFIDLTQFLPIYLSIYQNYY